MRFARNVPAAKPADAWRILSVDDDPAVHQATRFALQDLTFGGRPLAFETAESATQALDKLAGGEKPAIILLDVVMESPDAGLVFVETLRNKIGNRESRLLLRTGQPGYAPEADVLLNYDINDYLEKSSTTQDRLVSAVIIALRSFDQIRRLHETETALTAELARFRAVTEMLIDPVIVTDQQGRITMATPAVREVLGYREEDLLDTAFLDLIADDQIEDVGQIGADTGEAGRRRFRREDLRIRARDGAWRVMSASGRSGVDVPGLRGGVFLLRDDTRRHLSEEETRRTQKLEAIGRLAGGIAHDFNNVLNAVMGFASLLEDSVPPDTKERDYLDRIHAAGERGSDLVRQILSFARAEDVALGPMDLVEALRSAVDLARAGIGSDVGLGVTLPDAPLPVIGNDAQITQVVLNLAFNARDAVARSGGRIRIDCRRVDDVPAMLAEGAWSAEAWIGTVEADGSYAALRVADNGHGMSQAVVDRLCEPFFTTKDVGAGTGLGLSVVHGIVHVHRGALRIRSNEGKGSAFEVFLPVRDEADESADTIDTAHRNPPERRDISVLVVDDEPDVGRSVALTLARLGYRSEHMDDPVAALQRVESFDVVITDEMMPGLRGSELVRRATMTHGATSESPLFMIYTGFGAQLTEDSARAAGARYLLQKPIEISRLDNLILSAPVASSRSE